MKPFAARDRLATVSPALAVFLVANTLLAGCYEAIFVPKVSAPTLPTLQAGTEIELTDSSFKGDDYRVNADNELVRKRYRMTKPTYNGETLTFAQVSAMADP